MAPELKAKWVAALRSGQYEQTQRTLKDLRGYCCLGVLCAVTNPNGWSDGEWFYEKDGSESELPKTFRKAIGMSYSQEEELIRLNDEEQVDFTVIADHIEKSL